MRSSQSNGPAGVVHAQLHGGIGAFRRADTVQHGIGRFGGLARISVLGGEQEFQQLSQWAVANLSAEDLADYNAAVDSGNKAVARFALKQLQVRASMQQQGSEPELIGGGKPVMADVFESDQQAIEAMRKTNSKGQRLYNVDPKYRAWYEKTLQRSNVFQ